MLGTQDDLIAVSTTERFKKTVVAAGGRCELKLYENAIHGFFTSVPHTDQTIADMITFLTAIGWTRP